jgi:hypothetical protein
VSPAAVSRHMDAWSEAYGALFEARLGVVLCVGSGGGGRAGKRDLAVTAVIAGPCSSRRHLAVEGITANHNKLSAAIKLNPV